MASQKKKTFKALNTAIENLEKTVGHLTERFENRVKRFEAALTNVLDIKIIELEDKEEESKKKINKLITDMKKTEINSKDDRQIQIKCKECVKTFESRTTLLIRGHFGTSKWTLNMAGNTKDFKNL